MVHSCSFNRPQCICHATTIRDQSYIHICRTYDQLGTYRQSSTTHAITHTILQIISNCSWFISTHTFWKKAYSCDWRFVWWFGLRNGSSWLHNKRRLSFHEWMFDNIWSIFLHDSIWAFLGACCMVVCVLNCSAFICAYSDSCNMDFRFSCNNSISYHNIACFGRKSCFTICFFCSLADNCFDSKQLLYGGDKG